MELNNDLKKEYLSMYPEAIHRVREIQYEIEQLKLAAYLPKSPAGNDGTGSGSGLTEGRADLSVYVAAVDTIKREELEPAVRWQQDIRRMISKSIADLPSETERKIMRARYLELIQTPEERRKKQRGTEQPKWKHVAKMTHYSFDTVTHRHGTALQHLKVPPKIQIMLLARHAR